MADYYNIYWDTATECGYTYQSSYPEWKLKQARELLRKEQQELAKFDEYDQSEEGVDSVG